MTVEQLISNIALAIAVLVPLIGLVAWLVRLEAKTNATAAGVSANASALSAHIKAQSEALQAHAALSNDMGKEVVRLQEQVKNFGVQIERLTKAIEELGHPAIRRRTSDG